MFEIEYITNARNAIKKILLLNHSKQKSTDQQTSALRDLTEIDGTLDGDKDLGGAPSGLLKLVIQCEHISSTTLMLFLSDLMDVYEGKGLADPQQKLLEDAIRWLLRAMALTLKDQSVFNISKQIDIFLTWIVEYPSIDLKELLGFEVLQQWCKHDVCFAFKIIESQWKNLAATEILNILEHYAVMKSFQSQGNIVHGVKAVNGIMDFLVFGNQQLKEKLQSSPAITQRVQKFPRECKIWSLVEGTENKLPVVYSPVLQHPRVKQLREINSWSQGKTSIKPINLLAQLPLLAP